MVTFTSPKSPDIVIEIDFNTGMFYVWWYYFAEGENIGEIKMEDANLTISQILKGGWTMA